MDKIDFGSVSASLLGHASVMVVSGGKTIYIDPYKIPENSPKADIILVTHEHYDHCDPDVIRQLSDNDTKIVAAKGCASKIDGGVTETAAGDSMTVDDVSIKAIQAYNIEKPYHPKGLGVGYIIKVSDVKIYHAGDTDQIPEMKSLKDENIDIAFLP
ncbi:MAG: MBL fold metallo-hydrolase, partial [Candidatus Aenigmarchaeota archaeon]|nr:MBL fold metallo-hydrolase [Candidatus Aenigmarchaeota archaeon]